MVFSMIPGNIIIGIILDNIIIGATIILCIFFFSFCFLCAIIICMPMQCDHALWPDIIYKKLEPRVIIMHSYMHVCNYRESSFIAKEESIMIDLSDVPSSSVHFKACYLTQ